MSDFEKLLEELSALIEDAWEVPLSKSKIMVEREEITRIINGLNTHYPTELARANSLLDEREKILIKARTDSEKMIKDAQEKSAQILNQDDLVKESEAKAEQILKDANEEAQRIKTSAVEFADSVLKKAEEHYDNTLAVIKQARRIVNNSGK